jgi:predicted ester cyclase
VGAGPEEEAMPAQKTSNKATVMRLLEAVNSGDKELISQTIDEVFDPEVKQHAPFEVSGIQMLKEMVFTRLYRAFPDIHITLEDLIEEGDKVVEKDLVTGTHQGEFNGLPPTGRPVAYNEVFIMRFANGRIAEIWGVVDIFTQMKQLGRIPA